MKAIAIQQAARAADALLAAFGRLQPTRPKVRHREWTAHDDQVSFREPAGNLTWRAYGIRADYTTEGGVTMRRIGWETFRRVCNTPSNDN
ncbi:MAG: hypothetical protein JJ911_07855 [Rhizobiaceae bacterium]|nr:hypothetical protein [Rhizobiaceae bacterium]